MTHKDVIRNALKHYAEECLFQSSRREISPFARQEWAEEYRNCLKAFDEVDEL